MFTAISLRLGVPGPSFVGLCVGIGDVVAGVARLIARPH